MPSRGPGMSAVRHHRWIAALTLPLVAAWEEPMGLSLTSSAFRGGEPIPGMHTCDGADRSPALAWASAPASTASYALIADDPDAPGGTWVHWVVYDLPAGLTGLSADVPKVERPPDLGGAAQGQNDFRRLGYGGPCPPPGPAHHYHFKLYALGAKLGLKPGATKQEVERAMAGRILDSAELIGIYTRRGR